MVPNRRTEEDGFVPKAVSKSRIIMPPASGPPVFRGVTFDGTGVATKPVEAYTNRSRATVVDDSAPGAIGEGMIAGPQSIDPVEEGEG